MIDLLVHYTGSYLLARVELDIKRIPLIVLVDIVSSELLLNSLV